MRNVRFCRKIWFLSLQSLWRDLSRDQNRASISRRSGFTLTLPPSNPPNAGVNPGAYAVTKPNRCPHRADTMNTANPRRVLQTRVSQGRSNTTARTQRGRPHGIHIPHQNIRPATCQRHREKHGRSRNMGAQIARHGGQHSTRSHQQGVEVCASPLPPDCAWRTPPVDAQTAR